MYTYKVIQGSNWGVLAIIDPDAYFGASGTDPIGAGAMGFVDYWFTGDYGFPPQEVFDFYMPGGKAAHGQDIVVYLGWGGDGLAAAETSLRSFLDAGGNLFATGMDILFPFAGTYDYHTYEAGSFPYDYLKIGAGTDDFSDPDSTIMLYGVPTDIISDGYEMGIGVWDYCWAGGGYNYNGMVEILDGTGCFYYETGEIACCYYEDAVKGYKTVFFYFPIDYIVTGGCESDEAAQNEIAGRILLWLDIKFGVEEIATPNNYFLSKSMPNPVANIANISFSVPKAADVSLKVYDATGRVVSTLVDGKVDAGSHRVTWDAKDIASGVYFYRLNTNDFTQTRKMVVMH
jgi:hypothetical protein